MGLAERKIVQVIKDTDYKAFEKKIKDLCGATVKLTVDWAPLENNSEVAWINDNKKHNSFLFDPVSKAFSNVCGDAMGQSAVAEKLKEIKLVPQDGDLSFEGGVLTVSNDLTGKGAWDADQIQAALEKGL